MTRPRRRRSLYGFLLTAAIVVLVVSTTASAKPRISPPIVQAKESQLFALVVEPEKEVAVITMVEFYPPADFTVDSFEDAPGWGRDWTIQSGPRGVVQKATWTREHVPTGREEREEAVEQDAVFRFVAHPESSKTYAFEVRQTYSDGSVIDWRGPESFAFPRNPPRAVTKPPPTLVAKSSLAGSGGNRTLSIVALILGALGFVLAGTALLLVARRRAIR